MVDEAVGERGGDGLPPDGAAFLVQLDEAVVGVEVLQADGEGAAAATGGFGVQAEQECVEDDVVAARAGGGFDVFEFVGGQGSAGAGVAAWFRDPVRGAGKRIDVAIGTRVIEVVRTYVAAFVNQHLRYWHQPLLAGPSPRFPRGPLRDLDR
jgi:hypothetical protein